MALGIEKIYTYNNLKIKYIYKKAAYTNSNKLIISFSAFSTNGAKPQYSYIRTLEGFDVNQLFILDEYGGRGCYYLGEYPEFLVEEAIISLIESISKENYIDKKDIMCIGSSKGGWAALYFGIKLGVGYIIAGEPQTYIAKYLQDTRGYDVLSYMINREGTKEYLNLKYEILNMKLFDLLKIRNELPKVIIHAGRHSYHYKEHIIPFVEYIKKIDSKNQVVLNLEDYENHDALVKYYPRLLIKGIMSAFPELKNSLYIEHVFVSRIKNKFRLKVKHNAGVEFAWYVYLNDEMIFTKWYAPEDNFEYKVDSVGKYSFRVFASDKYENKISRATTSFYVEDI